MIINSTNNANNNVIYIIFIFLFDNFSCFFLVHVFLFFFSFLIFLFYSNNYITLKKNNFSPKINKFVVVIRSARGGGFHTCWTSFYTATPHESANQLFVYISRVHWWLPSDAGSRSGGKERNGKSSNDELQFLIVKWRVEIAKGKNGKRT